MSTKLLGVCALLGLTLSLLTAARPAAAADTAPNGSARTEEVVSAFLQGTSRQFQNLANLLSSRYPQLTSELADFIFSQNPDILTQLLPHIVPLLDTRYPQSITIIIEVVSGDQRLLLRVSALVNEQYPDFVADLAALPAGPSRSAQAAELVSRKYPTLSKSLIELITEEFPQVVAQIRDRILERHPEIIGDVARLMARTFPRLTAQLLNYIVHHCPELLPQLMAILYGTSTAPQQTEAPGVEPPPSDTAPATVAPPPADTPPPPAAPPAEPPAPVEEPAAPVEEPVAADEDPVPADEPVPADQPAPAHDEDAPPLEDEPPPAD